MSVNKKKYDPAFEIFVRFVRFEGSPGGGLLPGSGSLTELFKTSDPTLESLPEILDLIALIRKRLLEFLDSSGLLSG